MRFYVVIKVKPCFIWILFDLDPVPQKKTCKIKTNLHPAPERRKFYIVTSETNNDLIFRFCRVVCMQTSNENGKIDSSA